MAGFIFLPMATLVLLAVGRVLLAMGDAQGGHVVQRFALAAAVVWVLNVVAVVLVLGLRGMQPPPRRPPEE
jgi:hypothetical protein